MRRSTRRSSPRSACGAIGRTGPRTSPTSPSATSPASPRSSTPATRRSRMSLTASRRPTRQPQRRHHTRRCHRHAGPAPHHPPVFEALRRLRLLPRTTPSPRPWSGCWSRSTSTTSTTRTTLEKFYDSVRMRVQGVDTAEGRQKLIVQLYDTFFATAFPKKTVDKLGIVYTLVEIVDFILRSADDVLRQHFGQGSPTRECTSRRLRRHRHLHHPACCSSAHRAEGLARKVRNELHANEILLLAYYIAAVNIETTYQDLRVSSAIPATTSPSRSDPHRHLPVVGGGRPARHHRLRPEQRPPSSGSRPLTSRSSSATRPTRLVRLPPTTTTPTRSIPR